MAGAAAADDPLRFGVTTDDPWNDTTAQAAALAALPDRPALRVVFDEFIAPQDYREPLEELGAVATIMGELLDSSAAGAYDNEGYRRRVDAYLDTLWPLVDAWEIGNEVNGPWAGDPVDQAARVAYGFDAVHGRGGRTVLTLYANHSCTEGLGDDMFDWVEVNLPQRVRQGVDVVLLSWWPQDCPVAPPDWQAIFDRTGILFPHALLGIGESGSDDPAAKAERAAWCYDPPVIHDRFIGGCFWWSFRTDMVPAGTPLWQLLATAMTAP